jgi:Protein of unknown function (DUF4236)
MLQRRIRVLPGVHVNLSPSGIGVSLGPRGLHARRDGSRAAICERGPARHGFKRATIRRGEQLSELSFWPIAIAVAVLAVLLAVAVR